MSRYYQMNVEVQGFNKDKENDITAILKVNWNYDSCSSYIDEELGPVLSMTGDGYLTAGCTEEQYAEDTAKDVWEENGGYCFVVITATYLEDLPFEEYTFDDKAYEELVTNAKSNES